ncbi:MAG: zinc ribbon domain-containing protein [Verrucomicrobia bacterium]|nr:zinc ribbon domain-containing protein [Verrucomicrobiota bacterium]
MSTPTHPKHCSKCGAALAEGVRFCEQCGHAVTAPEAPPAAAMMPPVKAGGGRLWLTIVAAVVVGALGFAGYTQRAWLLDWLKPGSTAAPPVSTPQAGAVPAAPGLPVAPDAGAAQVTAETSEWFLKLPWVVELRRAMPHGVGMLLTAEPYDDDGWSEVSLRETHSKDSGFEPDVSPMIGLFRVARADRRIEWLDPVSGEFQSLQTFLKDHGLKSGGTVPVAPTGNGIIGGDFETAVPGGPNSDNVVIVDDPTQKGNHVARITGPDEMSFDLPFKLQAGTADATIALRMLHPLSSKLIAFDDGRMPEGIRLRLRLVNDIGNSAIRDAVVRPTGQWRELEFAFYDLPKKIVSVSVEAIWMQGPVYFDDVKLVPTKP